MAKGRRLISSRSERLLGVTSSHRYDYSHSDDVSSEATQLGEEDIWSMVDSSAENHRHVANYVGFNGGCNSRATVESGRSASRHVGGLSLAFEDRSAITTSSRRIVHQFVAGTRGPQQGERHVATSAPVNVPDWSKIYRVNSVESMHDSDDDDRVGDSGIEPPHEYLARSRKMNAMSVFEGVGRTLKGRDMSRVRDAVWSQTGFEG